MPERFAKTAVPVAERLRVAPGHFVTAFADAEMGRAAAPGQFFLVRLTGTNEPLLPRPFSIFDWWRDGDGEIAGFKVFYKVVGVGTAALSTLEPGDQAAVTGPLGNSFTIPPPAKKVLMVAGGIGIAPFPAFARTCIDAGVSPRHIELLYGAKTLRLLVGAEKFGDLGITVRLCSDDGSSPVKGTAVDLLAESLAGEGAEDVFVYASGPTGMLSAAARLCRSRGVEGEMSLEARMICGIGVCNSCAVRVNSRKDPDGWEYKLVCRDGPVFNARALYVE